MTEWLFWVAVSYFMIGSVLGLLATAVYLREDAPWDVRLAGRRAVLVHILKGIAITALVWPFALMLAILVDEED